MKHHDTHQPKNQLLIKGHLLFDKNRAVNLEMIVFPKAAEDYVFEFEKREVKELVEYDITSTNPMVLYHIGILVERYILSKEK